MPQSGVMPLVLRVCLKSRLAGPGQAEPKGAIPQLKPMAFT